MKTNRKHALTVSAGLLSTILALTGCSREVGADEATRAASDAARSAAEATGAARSAVDELVDANQALLYRVDELESRLAQAEGRDVERVAAPAARYEDDYRYERNRAPARTYNQSVSAEYEDYVPESSRTEYRYDDDRYRAEAQPALADADWTNNSRFRDVPRPQSPPRREEVRREPTYRRVTVEEGTPIAVEILDAVSTKYSRAGDAFNARLAKDLLADNGRVAVRRGAEIRGHVAEVKKSQRIGGRAGIVLVMDTLELPDGSNAPIKAAWSTTGKSQTPKDAATIGGATVGGAILGRILDDGDGDVIGGILGAAAGTAAARQMVGKPLVVGDGAVLNMHLRAPIAVRVRN